MKDKYIIDFTKGGVDVLETILTGGAALVIEKTVDAITGDDDHGWYCTITDIETEVRETRWGATKSEAQSTCFPELKKAVEEFKTEQRRQQEEENLLRQEELRQEYELERQLEMERRRNSDSTSSGGNSWLIKIIVIGVLALAVLWLLFAIVLPLVIINSAVITLIWGLLNKKRGKFLLPISFLATTLLVVDYNLGFVTYYLSVNAYFLAGIIPWLYCLNVVAGLVAAYFVLRNFMDAKYPQVEVNKEFNQRNLITIGSLLLVGSMIFYIQFFNRGSENNSISTADSIPSSIVIGSFSQLPEGISKEGYCCGYYYSQESMTGNYAFVTNHQEEGVAWLVVNNTIQRLDNCPVEGECNCETFCNTEYTVTLKNVTEYKYELVVKRKDGEQRSLNIWGVFYPC